MAPFPAFLRRSVVAACALSLLAAPLPPAWAQNQLPALGDSVSEDFGVGAERKLGDQIMREIRRDPDYLDDPVLQDYLQSLWEPLVAVARQRGEIGVDIDQRYAWEVFQVRDRSVNAFALPGGFVGVHLGLIAMTASGDELASVLAHELTHVTQRHIARSISNSRRTTLLSAAAMILGVLAAARSTRADGANAVIAGSQAAAIQGQLNFSRDMEREADRIGYSLLTGAGFAPAGMAAMFEKLDQASRLNDSGGYPYLRSHPLTTERIGEARSRLGAAPRAPAAGQIEHVLIQARARVLMDPRVHALRRWQQLDQDGPGRPAPNGSVTDPLAAAYSSALASTLLRDWARADTSLAQAAALLRTAQRSRADGARDPAADARAERSLAMLTAQSQLERGNPAAAAAALAAAPGRAQDSSRAAMLLSAQIALVATGPIGSGRAVAADTPEDAQLRRHADTLQTWVTNHPHDSVVWQSLAQVWGRLGQPLRSVRAEAEGRYAMGDLTGAVDRLRAGQRVARTGNSNDFIESSVIDARLRQIEAERKREFEERERRGG
jgi:predicted Zn-dependent protease